MPVVRNIPQKLIIVCLLVHFARFACQLSMHTPTCLYSLTSCSHTGTVCLQDIKALFSLNYNPFYARFGNRDTNKLSYQKIVIPNRKQTSRCPTLTKYMHEHSTWQLAPSLSHHYTTTIKTFVLAVYY